MVSLQLYMLFDGTVTVAVAASGISYERRWKSILFVCFLSCFFSHMQEKKKHENFSGQQNVFRC